MAKSILPRQALMTLSVLMSASLLWAGDKPWNGKPYQNWDAKDIQKILTHSPWIATTSVRRSWHPSQTNTGIQAVQQEIAGAVRTRPSGIAIPGAPNTNSGATPRGSRELMQQLNVYLYWYSSRVIRAACTREAVLHGKMDQSAVEKLTDAPQAEYQIVLRMDDLAPFIEKGENFYKQNAFLEMRRRKLKLPPSKVQFERTGTTSEDVVFFFPKTADGAPTIASDETDVVFSCKIADQTVHADFKPKKMLDQFGPDL
jgi:hypothetical protein